MPDLGTVRPIMRSGQSAEAAIQQSCQQGRQAWCQEDLLIIEVMPRSLKDGEHSHRCRKMWIVDQ